MFNPTEWTRLEKAFCAWAAAHPAVRCAFASGSRERIDPPPDEWSDIDLMIFVVHPEEYFQRQDWLSAMGEVWNAVPSYTAGRDPEWLVTYAGGYNVDFVLIDAGALSSLVQANPLPEPFVRGYRMLIDKDGIGAQLAPAPGKPANPPLPTDADFKRVVCSFWYAAFYVAKQLGRGELFMVKVRDGNLKELLLQMMAWHGLATNGPGVELWHLGRYMERWADPEAMRELSATFAHYDAVDSWRALWASLALFRRIACETAECLGFDYPVLLDEHMTSLITSICACQAES